MKTKILMLAISLIAAISQTSAQETKTEWKESKIFHGLMSASFHPAEEGNYAPLREKADSLFIVAKLWQASAMPADYKPTETKAALSKLVIQCSALKKAVDTKASGEMLMKKITEAHDTFHTIVGECRKTE